MKRYLYIAFILAASTCCFAQNQAQGPCENWLPGFPAHYCACSQTSRQFHYPLEMDINDTVWFQASINDLKQGLSAYWFADCSISFEVYAFCPSQLPTIQLTVGADRMREMDIAEINRKLDAMGDQARLLAQTLIPHVKVYPNGGSGRVYCYPFDEGPLSTCSDALPVIPHMTYVCNMPEEVYELKPEKISASGIGFIQWKQKQNLPCTLRLTTDSCNGPEIANVTLSDSMRVFIPDATTLKQIKQSNKSIFVHVNHDESYVGRIIYRNTIRWDEQRIDTTLCQGKSLQLADTVLNQTTVYPNDTLWKCSDTLLLTTYYLTIEPPTPQYDTLRLKANQLPYNYHNQIIPKNGWGDYDLTTRQSNQCDSRYLLHVEHDVVKQETVLDTTLCMGKTIVFGDVTYTKDTIIRDSLWANADTWVVRDVTIHFAEPEMEFDTVFVAPSEMTVNGYWYAGLGVLVREYGDTLIVKTKKNTCTRWIQLHVEEGEEVTVDIPSVQNTEETCKFLRDGVLYIRREGKEYDLLGRPVNR